MLKIIHTADWHLRDMQFGKTSRARDFTDSVFRIVDIAKNEGAKYILCAGDILNTKRPSSRNIADLIALNNKLLNNGIELMVITGNHDKCYPSWIKVLEDEMSGQKQCAIYDADFKIKELQGDNNEVYTMYGVPDMPPEDFKRESKNFPNATFLMFHALIKDFAAFDAGDRALTVKDLPTDKYEAILLGDIHTHKYIKAGKKNCLVGYPGSTELCSRMEDVNKFVTLITLDNGVIKDYKSLPIELNKPIIAKDIRTEEEANELLSEVYKLKDQHPTLLIRKDPRFTDLYARLSRMLDTSQCIIRVTNLNQAGFSLMSLTNRKGSNPIGKKPEDFVSDYFASNSAVFDLAKALCDPEAKAPPLIEDFIDKKLYANKKTTNKKFGQA